MKDKILLSSLKPFGVDIEGLDQNAIVERKGFVPEIKIIDGEERTITAAISTNSIDADGDMVVPGGCDLSRYVKNNIVIWNHNYSEPAIGKALEIRATNSAIEAKIQFADTPRAQEIWSLVRDRYLKSHSVGFITQESLMQGTQSYKTYCKDMGINEPNCRRIVTKWLLLEDSVVNIPSNPDALTQAISSKSISLSEKTIKELDLPVIETKEVKEIVEEVKVPEVPVVPEVEEEVVDLTVNDADMILTLEQVASWVTANGYKPLEKLEVERPVIIQAASIEEKPKFIIVREGDFKLTEEEKKLIAKDTLEEAELIKKALKRGRIV